MAPKRVDSVKKLATDLATLTETVAKSLANKTEAIALELARTDLAAQRTVIAESHKTFSLVMDRFDKVDAANTELHTAIEKHVEADEVIHKVVDQHSTYWTLAIKILLGVIAGVFALGLTWLNLR